MILEKNEGFSTNKIEDSKILKVVSRKGHYAIYFGSYIIKITDEEIKTKLIPSVSQDKQRMLRIIT